MYKRQAQNGVESENLGGASASPTQYWQNDRADQSEPRGEGLFELHCEMTGVFGLLGVVDSQRRVCTEQLLPLLFTCYATVPD